MMVLPPRSLRDLVGCIEGPGPADCKRRQCRGLAPHNRAEPGWPHCQTARHCEERSDEAIQTIAGRTGLLRCARNDAKNGLSFRLAHGKKRKRNAGRRSISCPARKRRAGRATESCGLRRPPLAGALASRRSTTALARGTRHPKGSARARLPGTWPKRSVLDARPNRGAETSRSLCGHYSRPEPVPVQRCTPHAGRSAGRHDARTARERG